MTPLIIAQFIICGICLAIGLLHLAIYSRMPQRRADLFFALMCFSTAAGAFFEGLAYQAGTIDGYNSVYRLQVDAQALLWFFMVWFIAEFTAAARRWLAILVAALYGLCFFVNIFSAYGILYAKIETLKTSLLPWGEQIVYAQGPANPLRLVADAGWLLMIYLMIESCVRLARRGQKQRAVFFGISLFVCLGPAYLHGTLVDLDLLAPPFYVSIGFMALILVVSGYLVKDVVMASELSREVAANEKRWRSLMQNVNLLVIGLDPQGIIRYVNPYFETVSGYAAEEALGMPIAEFVPEEERPELLQRLKAARRGTLRPHSTRPLLTRDGNQRLISWFQVIERESANQTSGILSIGEDITEFKQTEAARDNALQELESLKAKLEEENIYLRQELQNQSGFDEIVGESNSLLYVLTRVKQVAETDATVLIQGETGVGKELVARAIHQSSRRADRPFVRVNCAALPANLVESELFGHEKGAFTGADRLRKGRFELADSGTLLLDEISELPPETQAKLLRVLQEGQFERVGGSYTLSVDVRTIATTNRMLKDDIIEGRFRSDLYYRLNVYPITVPPLRSRLEDIPLLVQYFVAQISGEMVKKIDQVPPYVMARLREYDWPGNVRELRNVLEQAVIHSPGRILQLPKTFAEYPSRAAHNNPSNGFESLEIVEKEHILKVLEATGWRISGPKGAATVLGINPSTLRFRMNKLGIRKNS